MFGKCTKHLTETFCNPLSLGFNYMNYTANIIFLSSQYADSFFTNPFKTIRISVDASLMYYANSKHITDVFYNDVNGLIEDGSNACDLVCLSSFLKYNHSVLYTHTWYIYV